MISSKLRSAAKPRSRARFASKRVGQFLNDRPDRVVRLLPDQLLNVGACNPLQRLDLLANGHPHPRHGEVAARPDRLPVNPGCVKQEVHRRAGAGERVND